jgi:hypothetical protein
VLPSESVRDYALIRILIRPGRRRTFGRRVRSRLPRAFAAADKGVQMVGFLFGHLVSSFNYLRQSETLVFALLDRPDWRLSAD